MLHVEQYGKESDAVLKHFLPDLRQYSTVTPEFMPHVRGSAVCLLVHV